MPTTSAPQLTADTAEKRVRGGVPAASRETSSFARSMRNLLTAGLFLLAFCVAYPLGFTAYGFAFVLLGLPLIILVARLWRASRGQLEYGLLRRPLRRELRPHLVQAVNTWIFAALAGGLVVSAAFHHYSVQLSEGAYLALRIGVWAGIVLLAALALIPRRRVYLATTVLVALGSVFLAIQLVRINVPPLADPTVIDLPVEGEWYVFFGGRSELVNSGHYLLKAQRDALDIVKLVDGRTYEGDKNRLTSYAAFGEPILAPAEGRVTSLANGLRDQAIGKSDATNPLGNHLVIDIGDGRYVLMAHLKRGSIDVEKGDRVRRGEPVAQVGNSGQSAEPHLHIQVQNEPAFDIEQSSFNKPWYLVTNTVIGAGSLRTYPILFRNVVQTRGGEERRPDEADVRRGDSIRRIG
jgi:Peptidase family M23